MSALKTYLFILFGISAMLYIFGYTPPLVSLLSNFGINGVSGAADTNFVNTFLNGLLGIFTNLNFLAAIGISAVAGYLLGGGGGGTFSVWFLVPIFMLMAIINILVLPISFINAANVPIEIAVLTLGFMNILLGLTIMEFVRGG